MINKIIPASTVLIIRDGESGLEVFMVVRHQEIDFASGALVFPGGKVDKFDYDERLNHYLCEQETSDEENIPLRLQQFENALRKQMFYLLKIKMEEKLLAQMNYSG